MFVFSLILAIALAICIRRRRMRRLAELQRITIIPNHQCHDYQHSTIPVANNNYYTYPTSQPPIYPNSQAPPSYENYANQSHQNGQIGYQSSNNNYQQKI